MKMQSNTIFITGGTSGIGRGLAEAFHKLGNQVIISGRREENLRQICAAHPGMRYFVLDVTDPHSIRHVAAQIAREFPQLNVVFNNAGIQKRQDFASGRPLDEKALLEEINTNILGVVRVSSEFIPQLAGKPNATLVNVSSGLAFVPLTLFPVYCATKAFVHSFSLSLAPPVEREGNQGRRARAALRRNRARRHGQDGRRSASRRAATHAAGRVHRRHHEGACRRRRRSGSSARPRAWPLAPDWKAPRKSSPA